MKGKSKDLLGTAYIPQVFTWALDFAAVIVEAVLEDKEDTERCCGRGPPSRRQVLRRGIAQGRSSQHPMTRRGFCSFPTGTYSHTDLFGGL